MKQLAWVGFLLFSWGMSSPLFADPIMTDRAAMNKVGIAEIGLAPSYRQDKFEGSASNTNFTNTLTRVDLTGTYVPVKDVEARVVLPYDGNKISGGGTSSKSGLGQIILGGKYGFRSNMAGAVRFELPTGNRNKGLGEGLNTDIAYLGEKSFPTFHGYLNIGYLLTSEYTVSGTKVNPGDVIYVNLAGEKPYKNDIDVFGEFSFQQVGKSKVAKAAISQTDGHVIDVAVGAAKTLPNNWKLKGALALGFLSDEEVSSYDFTRPAGDWRLLLSASYPFSLSK